MVAGSIPATGSKLRHEGNPMNTQAICDREQCGYLGPTPAPPNLLGRVLASAGVAVFFHLGCFPLILLSPITFPVMILVAMGRMANRCPACKRGKLFPVDSPRGQAPWQAAGVGLSPAVRTNNSCLPKLAGGG